MAIDIDQVKKLREETQASIADCKKALEEASGDFDKALAILGKRGAQIAQKKADRKTSEGIVDSYIHLGGKVGVLVKLLCETDFVARTEEFKNLSHEISMQVAAMNPKDVKTLLSQEYIRDPKITIDGLVKQAVGKLGENIVVKEFVRFEL